MIKIDDGIPLPNICYNNGRKRLYPIQDLAVGQSFFAPGNTVKTLGAAITYASRKFPGRRFVSRTVDGGVRVWRVE